MRTVITLICILTARLSFAGYYYYQGERVPIVINPDSVVVYKANASLASGNFETQPSMEAKNKINDVLSQNNIVISSIEYVIGDSITRKMSNCFYVKLHHYSDTTILKNIVEQTRTHLLGEVPHMDRWYKIKVANSTINNSLEMSNYFYETGYFEDIDPGFAFEFAPNCVSDSEFASQWALPAIHACDAWQQTTGNPKTVVAIVDQGIDTSHREFANTMFSEYAYDCCADREVDTIQGDHGTMVAGVIAASHNDELIAGLAPDVTIMSVSHPLSPRYTSGQELASGISWAVEHGADVINCSWGDWGGMYYVCLHSALLEDALLYAVTEGREGKGCVVVFASGNAAENRMVVDYPACFTPELLVVGSINAQEKKSTFSGYGSTLDVVAPGEDIYLTMYGDSYIIDSGTSFAAPHVSAIASLMLSVNPTLTRKEVVDIIESTAQKVGDYDYIDYGFASPNGSRHVRVGYGLVDAYAAVSVAKIKYIQNHAYQSGSITVENYPEIIAGYAVTDNKPYGNVILEAGSDVTYSATEQVVLKPGFHAKAGSNLHIKIEDAIANIAASPQQVAPRSSSAPTDDADSTIKELANNGLETVTSNIIVSTSIYTISGQLIQTIIGGQHNATDLPNGMYILQYRMSDGTVKSEKVTNNK